MRWGDDDEPAAVPVSNQATTTTSTTVTQVEVEYQEVDVVVPCGEQEFHLQTDLPSIEAGPVRFNLTNHGAIEHQAMVVRFTEGTDFGRFAAAAASDPSGIAPLKLIEGFGGPNGVAPGETRSATAVLEPGRYMLICVIPDADQVPHAAKGMLHEFTVTDAAEAEPGDLGEHDGPHVEMVDFGFVGETTFEAGETVRVTNNGRQNHEVVAYRLKDGASLEDVLANEEDPTAVDKPTDDGAGLGLVAPGRTADFTLPETPGDYVLICFVPDVNGDGAPHHTLGMASQVTVG